MRAEAIIDVLFDINLNAVVAALIDVLVTVTVAVVSDNGADMLAGLNVYMFVIPASSEE